MKRDTFHGWMVREDMLARKASLLLEFLQGQMGQWLRFGAAGAKETRGGALSPLI